MEDRQKRDEAVLFMRMYRLKYLDGIMADQSHQIKVRDMEDRKKREEAKRIINDYRMQYEEIDFDEFEEYSDWDEDEEEDESMDGDGHEQ